ncbi:helix-turn-helix domain-containing protein [Streptomyces alkaliterrae]|uniref:Helix-turn-helix domain-containing protein n=2 Tax=Streptomyces alkaliterrae TaxID=2213162 RepID=A0A7W3ZUS9_9ACTN|nr:helix-turn-helix domain-containing protein [Streptomyces alkaliterrae]MBB1261160.1 helix-turn-helix domain-containing protein [Streptomyces alkaliterrae]
MSRHRPCGQLTVAQLVRFGPLSGARVFAGNHLHRPVTGVGLVSDLDQARRCEPQTAMVVHPAAAHGVWALEAALRCAWERNAACVVAPDTVPVSGSTTQLAERLRMPLLTVPDPAGIALEMAVAIADTEAARARLIARCAVLFGERFSLRGIVGVINSEVPGVIAALVTKEGHLLAGRAAAGGGDLAGPAEDHHRVTVPVPSADGRPWATLVARINTPSPAWAETVETILRLARAPLASAGAGTRLSLAHQGSRDRLLMETLLTGRPAQQPADEDGRHGVGHDGRESLPRGVEQSPEEIARDAGWPVDGRLVAVYLRPAGWEPQDLDAAAPGVTAAWQADLSDAPLVPLEHGWATWFTGAALTSEQVGQQVGRRLESARIPIPLSAGVGDVGEGMAGLRRSVTEAELAAAAASRRGGRVVELYGRLGPRAVLAALPVAELATAARTLLAPLLADPKADVLLATLAALLDCAGSTGQAAARLGVHRNTILGRVERIRAHGVDLNAPEQRLALHVACHALLDPAAPTP